MKDKDTKTWGDRKEYQKAYQKKYFPKYYKEHAEYYNEKSRTYFYENREKQLAYFRERYLKTKKRVLQRARERYKENGGRTTREKLDNNMAYGIWRTLKDKKGGRKWESLVVYTTEDLIKHLEKQFDENMTWGNYGSYWCIDHIKPISSFTYKDTDSDQFRECWSLRNLQPMEKIQNIKKGNKYEE